jgi:hypothetical protein
VCFIAAQQQQQQAARLAISTALQQCGLAAGWSGGFYYQTYLWLRICTIMGLELSSLLAGISSSNYIQCKPAMQQALDAESSNTSVQRCCMRPLLLLLLLLAQVCHP